MKSLSRSHSYLHPNILLVTMHRLLMGEEQPLKQITRGSDDKMTNSDQDLNTCLEDNL